MSETVSPPSVPPSLLLTPPSSPLPSPPHPSCADLADWAQPLRLEARVYLDPQRKPFSSCTPSGEARLGRGSFGGEWDRTGTRGFDHFTHKTRLGEGERGAMTMVFSALWVLFLCQLLASSSAQVRASSSSGAQWRHAWFLLLERCSGS